MPAIELRKQRDAKIQEMHSLTDGKTAFAPEAEARWNALDAEQKSLETQINMVERTETLQAEMRKVNPPASAAPGDTRTDDTNKVELEKRAFDTYIRRGRQAVEQNAELRTYAGLNTNDGGAGGDYTVPTGFQKELEVKLKAFGGMLSVARILNTSIGNTINWPTMDDTSNTGEWLTEAAPVSQLNPAFGQVNLASYLASSKQVLISVQLINDSSFDLEGELSSAFAIRLGRTLNAAYTSGNGSGLPTGLLKSGVISQSATAVGDPQSGNTDLNSVGYDDLDAVQAAVDAAYRANGSYMFSDATLQSLKKLKDSLGRPLWISSLTSAAPDTILGKKFVVNYSMPNIAAAAKSVIFGDFSKYIIRNVGGVTMIRYNELYMPNHQVGFQAYLRTDGQCIQPAAFAVLTHPAS